MDRDVVIIGGGVMGCALALRLAQRGRGVLVLERSVPGAEASSAAAGMLAPQQEASAPGLLLDLGLESRRRFGPLCAELTRATGIDVGYRRSGLLAIATSDDEWRRLRDKAGWQAGRGLAVEPLLPSELAALEPALAPAAGALRFPDEAQVDPPRLMRALQLAAARAGASFQSAWVRRIRHDGRRVAAIELEDDELLPRDVVVAAGSWSTLVEGSTLAAGAVRPVRGQMVELEARPAPLSHIVFAPGGYLVPRDDGRVTVGSTMEEVGFRREVTAGALAALLGAATRAVPALGQAPVNRFWSNFRPATADHLPLLGPTSVAGLHLCTGHFRNGILLAALSADLVAAAVCAEPTDVDLGPLLPTRLGR